MPEMAEALGEPLTTVEGRVYRALRKLRARARLTRRTVLGGDVAEP